MYRMKGNHGPRGVRMASTAFAFPFNVSSPADDRQPRNRLLAILVAGLGTALIIFGVAGLLVAASREAPELPGEQPAQDVLSAFTESSFEGARGHQLDYFFLAEPEDFA